MEFSADQPRGYQHTVRDHFFNPSGFIRIAHIHQQNACAGIDGNPVRHSDTSVNTICIRIAPSCSVSAIRSIKNDQNIIVEMQGIHSSPHVNPAYNLHGPGQSRINDRHCLFTCHIQIDAVCFDLIRLVNPGLLNIGLGKIASVFIRRLGIGTDGAVSNAFVQNTHGVLIFEIAFHLRIAAECGHGKYCRISGFSTTSGASANYQTTEKQDDSGRAFPCTTNII